MTVKRMFMKVCGILLVIVVLIAITPAGQVQAQTGDGDITISIKDLQGNNIAPGDHVKGDLWGVSQPTGGGGYTWHHMYKDAVDVGGVASVTWTYAEINAEVGLDSNSFYFAVNAWGGNPWANTQISSPTGLWDTFMLYGPSESAVSWEVRVITADVFPAHNTSSGVYYDLDLNGVTYTDSWANVNVTYQSCPVDVQPVISMETKTYMVGQGYSFSFNDVEGLLTITNTGTGFDQTYSAREDGEGGYIQELDTLGDGVVSYDDTNKQLVVDIDYASLGLIEGATYFVKPGFKMALDNPSYSTYSDLAASATPGYVGHTLDPLEVVAPVHNVNSGVGYFTIQDAIDAAADGDTIKVGPGTYDEYIELNKPNITVQSTDGADTTILDVPDGHLTTGVKVLANMGTVTFDGFTVKDFTENGIVQGMSAHEGTTFHVLNNKVIPAADYLRNGIQVTGDGSTVIGNFVEGAYLTTDWASTAIGVVNASNVLVQDNEVSGAVNGVDTGIAVYTWGDVTVTGNQVINNKIYNADYPLTVEAYDGGTTSDVDLHKNHVTNYDVPLLAEPWPDDSYHIPGVAVENVDASQNWWGSKYGPMSPIEGEATIIKWCANEACTEFLPDDNNVIENSGNVNVPGGIQINVPGITILLADGTVIQNDSPCFVINADNTKITTASLGGAKCVPTDGSNGIDVEDGLTDIIIEGIEIDGSGQDTGDGIHFAGGITDVILRDNLIHDLDDDGVDFTAAPAGTVQVQGNLFKDNGGFGLNATADLDVTYNAWGDVDGPVSGTDLPAIVTSYDPWTHVDLAMESSGTDVTDEVREGETITYTIKANLQKATGADFKLSFNPALVEVSGTTLGTIFTEPAVSGGQVIEYDNVAGEIHFAGVPVGGAEQSGKDLTLFTVTFTGKAAGVSGLNFGEDDFGMSPPSGPSNNIYAAALVDGSATVRNHYTVTGTVSMQGRTVRSGIEVTLTTNTGIAWGPFQATSTAPISDNVSMTKVVENEYQVTIEQDRYLDVVLASGKLVNVTADVNLNPLELFGGDVVDDEIIDVSDASLIGANYYGTGAADANFDGIVNIFDLALVGGNYGLTSATAYAGWTP